MVRRINFNPGSVPLSTLIGQIKNVARGGLDLQPEYQRDFVWNQDFKEKLIYSLIKRYPIGSISIRNLEEVNKKNARSEVVDGQQRLTTIYNFVTGTQENNFNNFKIRNEYARKICQEIISYMSDAVNDTKLEALKKKISKKGNISLKYSDLPNDIKEDLNSYPLAVSTISNATTQQVAEYFRFLQNQEALRAGEIMKAFPHTFLEKYLDELNNKDLLLSVLGFSDKRLEFDKIFYSIIGLFDKKIAFGVQDIVIKNYVFEKQSDLSDVAKKKIENMIKNLNSISSIGQYKNSYRPTKRYLKLLLLLCAFDFPSIDFQNKGKEILISLKKIDDKLSKFSSVEKNALQKAFNNDNSLIEKYRPFAQMSVRTHNYDTVANIMASLPDIILEVITAG